MLAITLRIQKLTMVYVPLLTAAGHRLMVNPKRNRPLFISLIEAQLAESRFALKERQFSYLRYRSQRGKAGGVPNGPSITWTVKNQLDKLDDQMFSQLDTDILKLAERPTPTGSKPKHYRWFLGELRRVTLGDFPIIYTLAENGPPLRILFIGFRRCRNPKKKSTLLGGRAKQNQSAQPAAKPQKSHNWIDRFIAYSGETPEELLSYPTEGQYDALVQAFREGIQHKAEHLGEQALTPEERSVLAVTALQQEVNNGGYDQFFRNDSRKFAPVIVTALERIGCRREARITEKALGALRVRKLNVKTIDDVMMTDSFERDQELERCDQRFYKAQSGTAKRLYAFVKKNRSSISFGNGQRTEP
jgi:mRNA-degrading endonuclease RelE of RelBE toxin-antitoxin system